MHFHSNWCIENFGLWGIAFITQTAALFIMWWSVNVFGIPQTRAMCYSACALFLLSAVLIAPQVDAYQAFDTNDMSADDMFQLYMKDSSHLTAEEGASLPPLAITKRVILDCSEVNWKDDSELVRYA